MNNLNPKEKELLERIDEVLFYIWDPISVSDDVDARDEYSDYAPKILDILLETDNAEKIIEKLNEIIQIIEIKSDLEKNKKVAEILLNYKRKILEK